MLVSRLIAILPENIYSVFSTHSPFLFYEKKIREKSNIYVVNKNNHSSDIELVDHSNNFVLKYPTWAELNYVAYSISSLEYHNLLFGEVVQEKGSIQNADIFLKSNGFSTRLYIEEDNMGTIKQRQCYHAPACGKHTANTDSNDRCLTGPTYIRHKSHHPENSRNRKFTELQLKSNIEKLREVI